ncbi:MAG: ABC transporter permease subunit [bacterium]|nr:ABC transporter permease subunit [bacterium]
MITFLLLTLVTTALLMLMARFGRMTVRQDISPNATAALTGGFVLLVMLGWWYVTHGARIEDRMLAPLILPSPAEVLMAFPRLHFEQALVYSVLVSFVRVTVGFTLAALLAVTLGVCMAAFTPLAAFFKPLALASAYVPIIVFIPLTLAWWGTTETQKIGFLFIACFVALLPLVVKAIDDVSAAYLDVAMTKGATQWQLVRYVLVPVAMADIWDHLRGVYGVGWGWIILAEVVNAQKGLGYLISVSERRGNTAAMFAVVIVIVAIAVLCDKLWRRSGMWLFPYRGKG